VLLVGGTGPTVGGDDNLGPESGAAYNPETDTWRTLAAAQQGIIDPSGAFADGIVYLVHEGSSERGSLSRYEVETDTWLESGRFRSTKWTLWSGAATRSS